MVLKGKEYLVDLFAQRPLLSHSRFLMEYICYINVLYINPVVSYCMKRSVDLLLVFNKTHQALAFPMI